MKTRVFEDICAAGKCDDDSDWVVVSVLFLVGDKTPSGNVSACAFVSACACVCVFVRL